MTVGANNHCCLRDFFGRGGFYDVELHQSVQCCITVFPGNTWTLSLNCFRYGLGEVLEVLRILDRIRGNTTENHVCRHNLPPAARNYTPLPSITNPRPARWSARRTGAAAWPRRFFVKGQRAKERFISTKSRRALQHLGGNCCAHERYFQRSSPSGKVWAKINTTSHDAFCRAHRGEFSIWAAFLLVVGAIARWLPGLRG
jgi:hypothetical protein